MTEHEDQGRTSRHPTDETMTVSVDPQAPTPGQLGPSIETQREVGDRVMQRLFGPHAGPARRFGRYQVTQRLGQGSMGTVYAARDPDLDREVAIKVLHRPLDDYYTKRLMREAQAMAKLSHPNVVHVYEVGRVDGRAFVVMELVKGKTLRRWMQRRPRPSWRQCVEVFIQLGQGLAAAHARGLVHRDFKPSNAIIDDEGRARVLDFGLARQARTQTHHEEGSVPEAPDTPEHERGIPTERARPALEASLTRTGIVMGTPAYMPLEQMQGQEADAHSDQFSFCAALYEAVYAQRPYPGQSIDTLADAVADGRIRSAPADTAVPRALRRALLRGLSIRPEQRWPSMPALLVELQRLVAPRRRWAGLILGVGLGAAGVGVAYRLGSEPASFDLRCTGAAMQLAGIWDDPRRQQVEAALLSTGLPYATSTWERVEARLDQYTAAWVETHTEVCEATAVRAEQSEQTMELRMGCLRHHKSVLRARVAMLAQADPEIVQKAVMLVADLPGLSRCDEVERLIEQRQRVPPPEDPEVARRVETLRSRLEDIDAEQQAGKYIQALEHVDPVVEQAEVLGYGPLRAEAKHQRGQLYSRKSQYREAEQDLVQAYALATEHGYDEVAFHAARSLADVVSDQARLAEGLQWGQTALPLAKRIGDAKALATSMKSLGNVREKQGRYEDAETLHRQALQIWERAFGVDHPNVASSVRSLGLALARQGKYEEAESLDRRALQIWERAFGVDHPNVASGLNNLGGILQMQAKYEEAESLHRRALQIWKRALGADHPNVASSFNNLGNIFQFRGDFEEAESQYRRALRIWERALGADHSSVALGLNNLATVLERQGRYQEAESRYRRALQIYERALGANHPNVASSLHNLGDVLLSLGEHEEAEAQFRRALGVWEQALGADHPAMANSVNILGDTFFIQKRYEESEAQHRRALRIWEQALGADHPDVAYPHIGLARTGLAQHEFETAREHAERAVSIRTASDVAPDLLAEARFLLARALWPDRSQRTRARDLAERARDALAAHGEGSEALRAKVEAWLAEHRVR